MKVAVNLLINLSLCIVVSFKATANTPEVVFSPIEKWITLIDVPIAPESKEERSTRYLLVDNQVDISGATKKHYFRTASQALNEQGLSTVSKVEIGFSPQYENLVVHDIHIIRDGKKLNKLDRNKLKVFQQEEQLQDNLYSETWTALFILEDIRAGDIVDYSYSILGSNPIFGEKHHGASFLSWGVPVDKVNFRLLSNRKDKVNIDVQNAHHEIIQTSSSEITEYTYTQTHVDAVREDDSAPQWYTPYTYVNYSEYDNWEDVNQWALGLYTNDKGLPDELITILEQYKSSNKMESAAGMIQWVQDNIRYFGIELGVNSHLPSLPNDTFNRRYGDCKDKATLMIAVLDYVGIQAHPVLVSTTKTERLNQHIASPGAFNHVIVTFNTEGKDYYVDATVSNQRGSLEDMSFPDLRWGLVVKNETDELTEIKPANVSQLEGRVEVEQVLLLGEKNQKSQLTVTTKYTGWKAEQYRSYIESVGIESSSKDHLDYHSKYFPDIELLSPIAVQDIPKENSLVITETYKVDDFTQQSGSNEKLVIYANQIIDNVWLPNVRRRQSPFTLPGALSIKINFQIVARDKSDFAWFDDEHTEMKENEWFSYSRAIEKNENKLTMKYAYQSLLPYLSAGDFVQYAKSLETMEETLSYSVLLKGSQPDSKVRARNLVKKLLNKNK